MSVILLQSDTVEPREMTQFGVFIGSAKLTQMVKNLTVFCLIVEVNVLPNLVWHGILALFSVLFFKAFDDIESKTYLLDRKYNA